MIVLMIVCGYTFIIIITFVIQHLVIFIIKIMKLMKIMITSLCSIDENLIPNTGINLYIIKKYRFFFLGDNFR